MKPGGHNKKFDMLIERQEGTMIVGDNGIGTINNYNGYGDINFNRLTAELEQLQLALSQRNNNEREKDLISQVLNAQKAAANKDNKGVVKYLKSTGLSGLKLAKELGLEIVANIISGSL